LLLVSLLQSGSALPPTTSGQQIQRSLAQAKAMHGIQMLPKTGLSAMIKLLAIRAHTFIREPAYLN